jgi:hypothetical protein
MPVRLGDLFAEGVLVRPTDSRMNLVHIVRAIATATGAGDYTSSPRIVELLSLIGEAQHLIFILIDGLGMNNVRNLPDESFIQTHLRAQITAGCPSTTACALTSIATAEYANCHGVTGWFTYLPEYELTATMLPFYERFTHLPLSHSAAASGWSSLSPATPSFCTSIIASSSSSFRAYSARSSRTLRKCPNQPTPTQISTAAAMAIHG